MLHDLYEHQGKCERIKKFPLPRQYAGTSVAFVGLFILLLPWSLASEFAKLDGLGIWLAVPFTVLVSWVFLTMELVGDYSEHPFNTLATGVPMLSLCRNIEIDLRGMLDETPLPGERLDDFVESLEGNEEHAQLPGERVPPKRVIGPNLGGFWADNVKREYREARPVDPAAPLESYRFTRFSSIS